LANWYCTREQVKLAGSIFGSTHNGRLDRLIEATSRRIDRETRRYFLPRTETRVYRWPPRQPSSGLILWLDQDLIAVTTLQTQAQNTSPTTISSSDFFLEPANTGPPYNRIEIDRSSTAVFQAGDTPQRSISVLGRWGFSEDTRGAGTVASGLDSGTTATTMVCSDGGLIDVGDTLLIESEQLFVSGRSNAALGSVLINGALTASMAEDVVADGSHGLLAGETIQVGSEQMFIESVSTNDLAVVRAYNGSVLASHNNDTAIHTLRTLTVERGVSGTTAAVHADATAISVIEPPFDISTACIADTLAAYAQETASWGRTVGTGEGAGEFTARDLAGRRGEVLMNYRRLRTAVI